MCHSSIIDMIEMRKSQKCTCIMRSELQDQYSRMHLVPCCVNTISFFSWALGAKKGKQETGAVRGTKKKVLMEHCLRNITGCKNPGAPFRPWWLGYLKWRLIFVGQHYRIFHNTCDQAFKVFLKVLENLCTPLHAPC
jgi:hypothetical protein